MFFLKNRRFDAINVESMKVNEYAYNKRYFVLCKIKNFYCLLYRNFSSSLRSLKKGNVVQERFTPAK